MRRLFIPACLCLVTWSGAMGPEAPWPFEAVASSTQAKNKTKDQKRPRHQEKHPGTGR